MKKTSTGRNLLANIIKSENIKYIFGNPGTTELAFMEEIGKFKDFNYILALQEAIVVSIADGFSRVKGDLSFVMQLVRFTMQKLQAHLLLLLLGNKNLVMELKSLFFTMI